MSERSRMMSVIRRSRRRRCRTLLSVCAVAAAFGLGWYAFVGDAYGTSGGGGKETSSNAAATSRYVAIAKGQVDLDSGIVRLAASRDGLIREVLVDEGDYVKKGQILLTIDDQQARLQLEQAQRELEEQRAALNPLRARLAVAQREANRLKPLADDESVSKQELDRAEGDVAVLRAEIVATTAAVASAESRAKVAAYEVEQRLVRAPLDGQIVQRQARPGEGISTLNVTSLFLFAPESPRIVRADLEERFVSAIEPGMTAQIALQADESRKFNGKVLRIGRVFGQRSHPTDDPADKQDVRTVECVLSIDGQGLLIGQRVLVSILPR